MELAVGRPEGIVRPCVLPIRVGSTVSVAFTHSWPAAVNATNLPSGDSAKLSKSLSPGG